MLPHACVQLFLFYGSTSRVQRFLKHVSNCNIIMRSNSFYPGPTRALMRPTVSTLMRRCQPVSTSCVRIFLPYASDSCYLMRPTPSTSCVHPLLPQRPTISTASLKGPYLSPRGRKTWTHARKSFCCALFCSDIIKRLVLRQGCNVKTRELYTAIILYFVLTNLGLSRSRSPVQQKKKNGSV